MPNQQQPNRPLPLEASAEMRSLLEHSERNVLVLDLDYRILWFNSKAAISMQRYYGKALNAGASYWDFAERENSLRFVRNVESALKGRTVSTERRLKSDGEHELWIDGTFSPLYYADDIITGVVYSYQNISKRKLEEKEASHRESIIRAINANESQAFVLIDGQNKVISCNPIASKMIGTGDFALDAADNSILDCIAPQWKDRFVGGLKLARSGGTVSIEFEHTKPKHRTVEIRFCPVNAKDEASLVSIWAFDITDKKKAEQEVRISEENLRSVFNSSSQTFYLLDHELNILAFNEPAKALVKEQYGRNLSIGVNVAEITPEERMPQFLAETLRAFDGKRVQVEKHFSKNGKEYWFERHINPIRNQYGVVDRVAMWSIDITDRKKAEEALRESESKFRKLASLMPVGVYQTDVQGNTAYVNNSLNAIVGASTGELMSGAWKKLIHPDDSDAVLHCWKKAEHDKQPYEIQYRITSASGTITHVLEQALPLYNNLKEYHGFLGTLIDLTAQRATQKLQQDKDIAERSLRFRSEFLASMSHEIRTPLTGIIGMTELLLSSNLSQSQRERVDNIFTASADLRSIVNDVLNLSELEAGKIAIHEESFSLEQLLHQVKNRFWPEAHNKGIGLRIEHLGSDPIICSDRRRITQILSNLTRNAIKFTLKGEVTVAASVANAKVRFEVHDTGIGIPQSELPKLFKAFSQLEHTTAQNLEGTGLGLSICQKLTTMMGGAIGVTSEYGSGSMFWFEIPLSNKELATDELKNHKTIASTEAMHKEILLVEDNLINQQAFKAMLRKMGCNVTLASNGEEAIAAFNRARYDLIFMDIQMPVMDGIAATDQIRAKGGVVPPIIGLSGNALKRDAEGKLNIAMDDFLVKPVVSKELERMIQKWTSTSSQ